jgi:hypothetical protein
MEITKEGVIGRLANRKGKFMEQKELKRMNRNSQFPCRHTELGSYHSHPFNMKSRQVENQFVLDSSENRLQNKPSP